MTPGGAPGCYVYDRFGRLRIVPATYYDPNRLVPYNAMFGQTQAAPDSAPPPTHEDPSPETLLDALKKITPTLLVVGVATGAAFAIGGGLVNRFFFRR